MCFDLVFTVVGQCVLISPQIGLALRHESVLDKRIEVRVEPSVLDLGSVVLLEFLVYVQALRFVKTADNEKKIRWNPVKSSISLVNTPVYLLISSM